MLRISRQYTIPPWKRHEVFDPVAEVTLGQDIVVETINFRTPIVRTLDDANPAKYMEREETGPIYVKDIEPGDVLAIEILDIRSEGHASGGRLDERDGNPLLEIRDGYVHFPGELKAPVHMMIGDIRVQPADKVPNPWDNGGNMDFRDIAAGHTLLLKAERSGGLLVLGDVHAVQGDGEMEGVAAECAAEVTLRIQKETDWPVVRPTVRKPYAFVSIASRADPLGYVRARDQAVEDAVRILTHIAGCTEQEARLFVRTVGHLRNGAVWAMDKTAPDWQRNLPLTIGVDVPLWM